MARLKSRTKHPPHDFQLLLPEIGMKAPVTGSFANIVDAFARIVQRNPGPAARFGWPTERRDQENFCDEREAARMLAMGRTDLVEIRYATPVYEYDPGVKKNWRGSVAAVVKGGQGARAAYAAMFGKEGPVTPDLANQRASVCAACPKNDKEGNFFSHFIESTANVLVAMVAAFKDRNLITEHDDKLGLCLACHCPLRAKVQSPVNAIAEHLDDEMRAKLDPSCWILREVPPH